MKKNHILTIGTEESMIIKTQTTMLEAFFGERVKYPNGKENIGLQTFLSDGKLVYKLIGVEVKGYNEVIARGMTGTSAFIDYQLYETEEYNDKLEDLVPIAAFEQTKTTEKESGNTSGWQRMTKVADFITRFGSSVPIYFVYETREEGVVEHRSSSIAAFAIYALYNINVIGKKCYLPEDLAELIKEWHKTDGKDKELNKKVFLAISMVINSTRERTNTVNYRIIFTENDPLGSKVMIQAKLAKGKDLSISADPSIGFCSGVFLLLQALDFHGEEVEIIKHGLQEEKVLVNRHRKGGKLHSVIKRLPFNVTLNGIKSNFEDSQVSDKYLASNFKGEKNVSIPFETWLTNGKPSEVSENGDTILFSNHAGCGKTFFRAPNVGEIETKKKKGIPDLIIANLIRKKIYVIEAEMAKNVKQGIEQLGEFIWIKDAFIKKYYPGYEIIDGVITYGELPNENDKRFWLNLDYDGNVYVADSMPEEMKKAIQTAISNLR